MHRIQRSKIGSFGSGMCIAVALRLGRAAWSWLTWLAILGSVNYTLQPHILNNDC